MLQIQEISKEYNTGDFTQKALDHVSLSLRDNEFVAILGPSGSGKTTLLNVIGGLDRYDSGNLIINGTSTKKYSDRDWDAYRNHSVGFVFQSYNLIPHQTVLANVELALTIGGISKRERTRRAAQALERVGLSEHIHKHPNQLSGGQMQRVAIARALVNEPDILLADEPTGALDSETSLQVMELLKEVASDRLVVMVTHNPDLAQQYATRIVELKDGRIIGDSDPFSPELQTAVNEKRLGKASMSFLTALGLSFNNLRTKLKRTLLVSFAGSIGIIGIALILSLSNGMSTYIDTIQRETLSEYPVQLLRNSVDLSAFNTQQETAPAERPADAEVFERQTLGRMFSMASSNDLASVKVYLDAHRSDLDPYSQALEYRYNLSPLIYSEQYGNAVQVHPNRTFSFLGMQANTDMMSSFYSAMTDVFHMMPQSSSLYEKQYELQAGKWPESYNEVILVLTQGSRVTDMALYSMGLKNQTELEEMIRTFMNGGTVEIQEKNQTYRYEDFIGIEFRLVQRPDLYTYDENYGIWTDHSDDAAYVKKLVSESETLRIVGVVKAKEDTTAAMLTPGLNYLPSLVEHVATYSEESGIVRSQLETPDVNVLTGTKFDEPDTASFPDLSTLFTIDADAVSKAFVFDETAFSMDPSDFADLGSDLSSYADPGMFAELIPEMTSEQITELLSSVKVDITLDKMQAMFEDVLRSYLEYASEDPETDYSHLPEAVRAYFETDAARQIISDDIRDIISGSGAQVLTPDRMQNMVRSIMEGFAEYVRSSGALDPASLIAQYLTGQLDLSSIEQMYADLLSEYLASPQVQALIEQEIGTMINDLSALEISEEQIAGLVEDLLEGYETYAKDEGLPLPSRMQDSFAEYLELPETREKILSEASAMIDTTELERKLAETVGSYTDSISNGLAGIMQNLVSAIMENLSGAMEKAMASAAEQLPNAISIDSDAFADAFKMNLDQNELRNLFGSYMSAETSTYDDNLSKFGYNDLSNPNEILIYPKSFEAKNEIIRVIETYNELMTSTDQDEKVIRYTDIVGTMMSSVTDIIDAISYVLIAFVAVSLIVSSIMIGVITYISVLERRKEIGILRAIGASKHNVSSVFNAETFIIGALAGMIGVGLSYLFLIPINIIIHSLTGQADLNAVLPVISAFILILLSIVLTLIGGLIPSRSAAKCDPVAALRTE